VNVEVILHQGRYHLVVNGVYIAMEGDDYPCRDPAITGNRWTKGTLEQAATLIREARWTSAAERWKKGPC
jgi:hypothetical protein